jgi:hypothetical protein
MYMQQLSGHGLCLVWHLPQKCSRRLPIRGLKRRYAIRTCDGSVADTAALERHINIDTLIVAPHRHDEVRDLGGAHTFLQYEWLDKIKQVFR